MKVDFKLVQGYEAILSNSRGHEITIDLPVASKGTDKGAKSFEVLAMSLVGYIGTIFKFMADKMQIDVQELRVEMETTDGDTIEAVDYKLYLKSESDFAKIEKALKLTEDTCPVGLLFHKAGVPMKHEIIML